MKIQYLGCSSLVLFALALLFISPRADAQDVPSVAQLESQFETQLNTRLEPYGQPKATSYYDDQVDRYEQGQLMRDVIDEGIR